MVVCWIYGSSIELLECVIARLQVQPFILSLLLSAWRIHTNLHRLAANLCLLAHVWLLQKSSHIEVTIVANRTSQGLRFRTLNPKP